MKHPQLRRVVAGLLVCAMLQVISALNLNAYTSYDGSNCAVLGSISVVPGICASSTCVNGAGVSCITDSNYKGTIAAAFSVNSVPYVTISTFMYYYSCTADFLVKATAYAADGLCHPLANSNTATYFKVKVYEINANAGSDSVVATISTFANNVCTALDQNTLDVNLSKSDVTSSSDCRNNWQVDLSPDWPMEVTSMALKATTAFDSSDCAKTLGSISITPKTCSSATDSCVSGAGTFCTSSAKYKTKIASAFGTAQYMMVSTFSGSVCTLGTVVTVQAYAADGKCHAIGSKFFKVTISADLTTSIANFSDAGCTTADGVGLLVTAQKLTAGCDNAAHASRYEVSANWPVTVNTLVYFDGLDCTKTVGSIQMTASSSACTATVCTGGSRTFCSTNYNYETTVAAAFGMTPYITVSKFSGTACTAATLVSATAYAADGQCHPLGNGKFYMVVTQSTTEQVMTIKRFTNAWCSFSDSSNPDILVTKTRLTTNLGCNGAAQAIQYKVSGTVQQSSGVALKAVAAFDDGDCTKTLGSMIVAPGACTSENSCIAGTWITCTTNYNYETPITAAFGAARYVMVSVFWGATCSWMTLESATAYAADGRCHSLGMKYFTVTANSANAVISTYTDPSCTTLVNTNTISVTTTPGCNSGMSMRLTLSPNWFTRVDVAGIYAAASCTGTASKLVLTDSVGSACSKTCSGNTLSDCTSNSTYKSYLDAAFGAVPYLIKETYSEAFCGTRSSITAYAADGSCYADGSKSFKVLPVAGNMAFTTFTTSICAGAGTTTTVTNASLLSNLCVVSSEYAKYSMGGDWQLTTAAVYDDSNCALTPSKLSFALTAKCTIPTATCKYASSTGYGTVFVAPGCAKASSYMSTIDKAFGMTPYVVQETYSASGCSGLTEVTAYVADGLCHLGGDAATSYRVTWNPTSLNYAVTIETFSSAGCYTGAYFPTTVGSAAIGGTCSSDIKKVYVGGLTNKLTAVATFSDSACTKPVQVVFSSIATTCITQSKCTPAAVGLYMKQGCATDNGTFLTDLFQTTRRLVTDIYEANSSYQCATRQGIVAYVGDGVCHPSIDGATSFNVTLGGSNMDDAELVTYNSVNCTGRENSLTITANTLAYGSCDYETGMKFAVSGGETPTPSPTTATTGSGTSSATSFLSVPIFGFMTTAGGVIGGIFILMS
ncbi:hypothetical protein V7S43_011731 [Phytophthora oleae]|uniref:Uncharacterized protein n=1 Tax=Phytophthora oleae TaxID=2107226 RepID=A0ABD3F9A7_9STRA